MITQPALAPRVALLCRQALEEFESARIPRTKYIADVNKAFGNAACKTKGPGARRRTQARMRSRLRPLPGSPPLRDLRLPRARCMGQRSQCVKLMCQADVSG